MNKPDEIIEKILKETKGLDTHIIVNSYKNHLTRFADNEVSQHISTTDLYASIRVISGNKVVKFNLNRFDDESIKDAVNKAKEKFKFIKEEKDVPFATKTSLKIDSKKYCDLKLLSLSPQERVSKISKFLKFSKRTNRNSYGVINNTHSTTTISNSYGLFQRFSKTQIEYSITVSKDGGYGKSYAVSYRDDINYDEVNEIALKKSDLSKNPQDIKPGKYTVIIEPMGVSDLLSFMGWLGFNGLFYYEKRSFASENLGKKIFSDLLTIIEDPVDFPGAVMPFDLEGYPRERVVLVENGVLKNIVTDKKTSKLCNLKYTGHSFFEPNNIGAIPVAMVVEKGDKTIDEIIKETENAILITEFHYTNPLKQKDLEITGMTRNGTYLIENGKIKKAIKNLRFTQSIIEAFNNILEVSSDRKMFIDYDSGVLTPALKIDKFNFTSSTQF